MPRPRRDGRPESADRRPRVSHAARLPTAQFWYVLSEDPPFAVKAVSPQFCIAHRAAGPPDRRRGAAEDGAPGGGGGPQEASLRWEGWGAGGAAGAGKPGVRLRCELLQYATGLALGAGGRSLVLSYGVMDSVRPAAGGVRVSAQSLSHCCCVCSPERSAALRREISAAGGHGCLEPSLRPRLTLLPALSGGSRGRDQSE